LIGAYLIIVSYQYRAGASIVTYVFPDAGMRLRELAMPWFPALSDAPLAAWDKVPGVIGVGAFIVLYTMLAGMISVAWTDVLNGVLMAMGIFVALAILLTKYLAADPASLPVVRALRQPVASVTVIGWIGYLLPPLLLVLGDANLYQRFMSARSPGAARRAAVWMFVGVLAMEWAIIVLACLGRQLLPEEPPIHGRTIIAIAFSLLPSWVGVLLIMSAVAVIVSTADSYLLGSATSVSADLAGRLTTATRQRVIVLVLGLLAMALAFTSDRFFTIAIYAYTLYGATLTPAIVCALIAPRVPSAAIVSGMACGLLTALFWKAALVHECLPGFIAHVEPVLPALAVHLMVLCGLTRWIGLTRKTDEESRTIAPGRRP
jgi:Na+/proline symporter